MALLKRALHLLELIEDRKYGDAAALTKSVAEEGNEVLEGFAPDLICKVAYSFGNEDSPHRKDLLMGLFSLMLSVEEKYRLCYELLTLRTSPELTEVLVSQLGTLISTVFQTQHPKLWNQLCNELPLKLEQRLCQRLASKDEDAMLAITEAAHVLRFFDEIPFRVPHKFNRLVDSILSELPVEEAATYPFLIWYAREHPFSPKLVGRTKPTVFIPNVYDQRYLRLRLTEGICEYVTNTETPTDGSVKSLTNALRFLLKLSNDCQEICTSHIKLYSEMFLLVLRFITDIDSETRGVIMAMLQGIISYFPVQPRALLLKNIVFGITSKTADHLKHESKALAWLLDQFEHHLNEKVFENELGSLFGVLEDVIYDDIVDSRSFYASLLRLIRSFTRNCANTKLLAEVRKRFIVRLYKNLVEYLRLDTMNEKSRASQMDQILSVEPVCPFLGAELDQIPPVKPVCSSSSADENDYPLIVSVLKDCEESLVIIDQVLQNSLI